jgi:trimeric autotransporter adhesin
MKHTFRTAAFALTGAAVLALAACGGGGGGGGTTPGADGGTGGSATTPIAGIVADGLIQGATVCYDLNDNGRCDDGEPVSSGTGTDGAYTLAVPAEEAGKHAVIAMVPATAIDQDNPGVPVGTAFTLKSPAQADTSKSVFVSPLTDAVVQLMAAAGTTDPAAAIAQLQQVLGLTMSPLENFVAARTGGTAEQQAAAQQAGTYAQVLTEVKKEIGKTAEAAGVETEKKEALISVVVLNTLNTLATSVASSTGTVAELGQSIVQSQGINTTTVAVQADIAAQVTASTPDTSTSAAPFVIVRDVRYTNANNWSYRLFSGDGSTASDGWQYSNEIRRQKSSGSMRTFQRDVSYYDEAAAAWYECPSSGYMVSRTRMTSGGVTESLFCNTIAGTARRTDESIAGSTLRSVLEKVRGSGIAGYDTWGAAPSALTDADAVFPAGSVLRYQLDTQTQNPDSHSLSNKIRVVPPGTGPTDPVPYDTWPFASTLEQFVAANPGFNAATVTGNITDQLGEAPDTSVTDPTLQKRAFYRVGFASTGPSAGNTRYYLCRRLVAGPTTSCSTLGDGTYTIEAKADSRVLRLAGIPATIVALTGSSRIYVERAGAIFYGSKVVAQTTTSIRINKPAWEALLAQLPGVVAHTEPTAPPALDAAKWLREIRDLGDNGFTYRIIESLGTTGGTINEVRVTYDGSDALVPFLRNRIFWTGSAWTSSEDLCPSSGIGFGTWTANPRASTQCGGVMSDTSTGFDAEIAGKTMSFVVNEARKLGGRDNGQDFRNWGPTVLSTDPEYGSFTTALFPAGSKLRYQVATSVNVADTIALDSSVKNSGQTATLVSFAEMTGMYTAGFGGTPVNGGTTLGIYSYQMTGTPASGTTGQKRVRASFGAGNTVKFFLCDQSAVMGPSTINCAETSSSTYTVTAQGGKNVMRFAALPTDITSLGQFTRIVVEHDGAVYLGSRGIPGTKSYTLRLNETAYTALFGLFGETVPSATTTPP